MWPRMTEQAKRDKGHEACLPEWPKWKYWGFIQSNPMSLRVCVCVYIYPICLLKNFFWHWIFLVIACEPSVVTRGILLLQAAVKFMPPALGAWSLNTGSPGKSLQCIFFDTANVYFPNELFRDTPNFPSDSDLSWNSVPTHFIFLRFTFDRDQDAEFTFLWAIVLGNKQNKNNRRWHV